MEKAQVTKVEVNIYDEKYTIKGNGDPLQIKTVADYVDKKMRLISDRNLRLSPYNVAVLAALNLADELSKLQKDYDGLVKMIQADK